MEVFDKILTYISKCFQNIKDGTQLCIGFDKEKYFLLTGIFQIFFYTDVQISIVYF